MTTGESGGKSRTSMEKKMTKDVVKTKAIPANDVAVEVKSAGHDGNIGSVVSIADSEDSEDLMWNVTIATKIVGPNITYKGSTATVSGSLSGMNHLTSIGITIVINNETLILDNNHSAHMIDTAVSENGSGASTNTDGESAGAAT